MVGLRQHVAFEDPADADRRARIFQLDEIEPEPMTRVTGDRSFLDIPARVVQRAHAAIADVADEGRLVQQHQHERRVTFRQSTELEPGCL
jgi:hypothetical protein